VDIPRKRIALSMKASPEIGGARKPQTGPQSGPARPKQSFTPANKPADWFTEALNKGRKP
jgi:hypothetical protein